MIGYDVLEENQPVVKCAGREPIKLKRKIGDALIKLCAGGIIEQVDESVSWIGLCIVVMVKIRYGS